MVSRWFAGAGWAAMLALLLAISGWPPIDAGRTRAAAAEPAAGEPAEAADEAARRGYRWLTEKAYVGLDFDEETFAEVWKQWPEPLRGQAAAADPAGRRRMAFERYGLTPRPGDASGKPLQYVVDGEGNWGMNCFACHGGEVAGQVVPGLPNAHYALETLTEETRAAKLALGKPFSRMDLGFLFMPLGGTDGTTNAVMFGVALMAFRDADLNFHADRAQPRMTHHDMDAIPWWHFRKRERMYIDGFAQKGHRALMQFTLIRQNGPEKFREWESDFRDIYAYLQTLRPPRYPFPIDEPLATLGKSVFQSHCAKCHGTYGAEESYPHVVVPIDEIGTDRVRFDSLTEAHRSAYAASWFAHYGEEKTEVRPKGYLAPPLDGVWASAPYFHNGSVPTLWHVLHPSERPAVWTRRGREYDPSRVGVSVESLVEVPTDARKDKIERRRYFDSTKAGKSNAGHDYPDVLTPAEKQAVLEYLKTL